MQLLPGVIVEAMAVDTVDRHDVAAIEARDSVAALVGHHVATVVVHHGATATLHQAASLSSRIMGMERATLVDHASIAKAMGHLAAMAVIKGMATAIATGSEAEVAMVAKEAAMEIVIATAEDVVETATDSGTKVAMVATMETMDIMIAMDRPTAMVALKATNSDVAFLTTDVIPTCMEASMDLMESRA